MEFGAADIVPLASTADVAMLASLDKGGCTLLSAGVNLSEMTVCHSGDADDGSPFSLPARMPSFNPSSAFTTPTSEAALVEGPAFCPSRALPPFLRPLPFGHR